MITDPVPPPAAPVPEAGPHPLISAVNTVLSPPPVAPAGVLKIRDWGRAAVSALVKSGVLYAALAALGSVKDTPIWVAAVIMFASTLLRLYTAEPVRQGAAAGPGG